MDAGKDAAVTPRRWAAVAGFQAGMAGALVLLLAVGLASAWYRRGFWGPAGVMASLFYGDAAIGRGLGWSTLSGAAVYLIFYSLFGAVVAAIMHESGWSRGRLTLLGILAGAAWYYFCFGLLWKYANPLVGIYTHDRPMFWGHLLYGAMLGRYPVYLARMAAPRRAAPTPAKSAASQPAEESPRVPDSHLG
jgi:hypothetical protein